MSELAGPWVRPRPDAGGLRIDAFTALALAAAAAMTAALYHRTGIFPDPPPPWVWVLGLGLCTLPLAFRRIAPVPVAIVVAIGFFICGEFRVPEALMINISLYLALYSVGAWEPNRTLALWTRIGIGGGMVGWLIISTIVQSAQTDLLPGISRSGVFSAYATYAVIQVFTNLLYFVAAAYFGERAWNSARERALLEARGTELALERETIATQAVALDRVAIARELHDVVAHHVSVMGIQAAAARRSLGADPAAAAAALEVVETSARDAVSELRTLVHTLREPGDDSGAATVGLGQLGALVEESRAAGVPVELIVAGEARPLPMLVDVALFRVAQEALTNVRKHAGRGASAEVRLRFGAGEVEVEVTDTGGRAVRDVAEHGAGAPVGLGGGLGLRGMRERIGAVGGTVEVRPRETSSGFLVRARVPLGASS